MDQRTPSTPPPPADAPRPLLGSGDRWRGLVAEVWPQPPPPERFVLEKQPEEKESGCCRCVIM